MVGPPVVRRGDGRRGRGVASRGDTEHAHQAVVVKWARWIATGGTRSTYGMLRWLFAVPNGGLRHKITAARLVAEGVAAGVPDLLLPVAWRGHNGVALEMKAPGRVQQGVRACTDAQVAWLEHFAAEGWCAVVAFGAMAGIMALEYYLTGEWGSSVVCERTSHNVWIVRPAAVR